MLQRQKNENIWNIFFQFWLEKRNFAFFITRKVSAIKTGKKLKILKKNKNKKAPGYIENNKNIVKINFSVPRAWTDMGRLGFIFLTFLNILGFGYVLEQF